MSYAMNPDVRFLVFMNPKESLPSSLERNVK
jgi:hypothetical protein